MKDYEWNEEFGTQKANVRAWLLNGNSITQLEALNRCVRRDYRLLRKNYRCHLASVWPTIIFRKIILSH